MNALMKWMGVAGLLLATAAPAGAADLMMTRVDRAFPEAMALLQSAISSRGYKITRLQEVNENLERRDYKSDMYRVVYFGKYEEVKQATAREPGLIPFLPLNITIFAEGDQVILVAGHPRTLQKFFPDAALKPLFERWEKDMVAIMDEAREAR